MSTIAVIPTHRQHPAGPDPGVIEITAPPRQTESMPITGSMGMILVPAASGVGAVLLAVTQQSRPLLAAAGLLVLAASIIVGVVMVVGSRTGDRRRTREQRERYLDYLERVRQEARTSASHQLSIARSTHPPPTAAASAAYSVSHRWERRPGDGDFLVVRIGLGTVPLHRPVVLGFPLDDPLVSYDEVCLAAAKALVGQYPQLADQPICLPLDAVATVTMHGDKETVRAVARALLGQLVWAHSPADVGIMVISDHPSADWDWLKWLPHNVSKVARDGPVGSRMFARTIAQGTALLAAETAVGTIAHHQPARKLLVLVDVPVDSSAVPADLAALRTTGRAAGAVLLHLTERLAEEWHRPDIRVAVGEDDAWPDRVGQHRR